MIYKVVIEFAAQKMKFSVKEFLSKLGQIRKSLVDLVTFTEEILNGKLHFLCSDFLALNSRSSNKAN